MESKDQHPQLSHLGIFTDQQEKMRLFYENASGLLVTDIGVAHKFRRRIVFMTSATNQHHRFVLVQREAGDPPLGPLFQLSFKVDSFDGIRRAQASTASAACRVARARTACTA